jgi:1-aminocyclopropane-1-carboxylate deaminase/D-cysteine desulfhydrase-like pyridoxal-dependent ACC family enzyme
VLAIGVAKGVNAGTPDIVELAGDALELLERPAGLVVGSDVLLDHGWLGDDYAVPTAAGDGAMRWAATTGGWVLDRTYTGKGMAGLLGNAAKGRWAPGADVIFVHTGGMPAVFAPGGAPETP